MRQPVGKSLIPHAGFCHFSNHGGDAWGSGDKSRIQKNNPFACLYVFLLHRRRLVRSACTKVSWLGKMPGHSCAPWTHRKSRRKRGVVGQINGGFLLVGIQSLIRKNPPKPLP